MKLTEKLYENENFYGAEIGNDTLSGIKFVNCDFREANFSDASTINRCAFDTCKLNGANFGGVNLRNCAFLSCNFQSASFFATAFDDCKMTGSDFTGASCDTMSVFGGDWSYTVLRHQVFLKQDFSGVNFTGAELSGCKFRFCRLNACNFNEAIVHETSFYGSDLRDACIDALEIADIDWKDAKLDVYQCVLIAENLTQAKCVADDAVKAGRSK